MDDVEKAVISLMKRFRYYGYSAACKENDDHNKKDDSDNSLDQNNGNNNNNNNDDYNGGNKKTHIHQIEYLVSLLQAEQHLKGTYVSHHEHSVEQCCLMTDIEVSEAVDYFKCVM